jgi:small subunit ribosomal protein S14
MAKTSQLARNAKKVKLTKKYAEKRAALIAAGDYEGLQKLPKQFLSGPHQESLRHLWSQPRLHARFRRLPHRVPRTRSRRQDPGRKESIMVTDRVGDFIIRLKNAGAIGNPTVTVPHSKHIEAIANKLKELGFVERVEVSKTRRAHARSDARV